VVRDAGEGAASSHRPARHSAQARHREACLPTAAIPDYDRAACLCARLKALKPSSHTARPLGSDATSCSYTRPYSRQARRRYSSDARGAATQIARQIKCRSRATRCTDGGDITSEPAGVAADAHPADGGVGVWPRGAATGEPRRPATGAGADGWRCQGGLARPRGKCWETVPYFLGAQRPVRGERGEVPAPGVSPSATARAATFRTALGSRREPQR
jgi:hypothetical protein